MKKQFKFFNLAKGSDTKHYHHSLVIFGISVWSLYYYDSFGWLRLFGRRITWMNRAVHPESFSERMGKKKFIRIGKWRIGT